MNICVIISCMYQADFDIIRRSNIQTDCVVVNQCDFDRIDEFDFINRYGVSKHCKFISTTERGLSKSRNMAIRNTDADVCLICDDDEILEDDYGEVLGTTYSSYDADVIAFIIERSDIKKEYPSEIKKIGFRMCHRISSVQISFKKKTIEKANIFFDEQIGSGSGNGPGEDTKWLIDCYKKRLKAIFCPQVIGKLTNNSVSQWFNGYNKKYFLDRGYVTRRIHGKGLGMMYNVYWCLSHRNLYKTSVPLYKALLYTFQGLAQNREH